MELPAMRSSSWPRSSTDPDRLNRMPPGVGLRVGFEGKITFLLLLQHVAQFTLSERTVPAHAKAVAQFGAEVGIELPVDERDDAHADQRAQRRDGHVLLASHGSPCVPR